MEAGLLVVDEVHNIAGGDDATRYDALSTLAHAIPRLLLLSATPLLHNEDTFLRMLHLLDPDVYRLDDAEGFRRRVRGPPSAWNCLLHVQVGRSGVPTAREGRHATRHVRG